MSRHREPLPPGATDDRPIPREAPRAPTEAQWAALSPEEQEEAIDRLVSSVSEEEEEERMAMAEGDQHLDSKIAARDTLRRYFHRIRRSIYIGADITVYYPGEKGFTPDLIAIRDVDPHPRTCWMVSRERKGVDLALEVYFRGDWSKDYVRNVARYAQLGIHEYFIFDVNRQHLTGHRLVAPGARAYVPLRPTDGRYTSEVLGLELAVEDERLRFYTGTAMVLSIDELLDKERERAEQERERAAKERERLQGAIGTLRESILLALRARDLTLDDEQRGRLEATDDVGLLDRWLRRAFTVQAPAELFRDG